MDELQQLKAQVKELTRRLDERDKQQLKFPLDVTSANVIADALKNTRLEHINVKNIYFLAGQQVNPTVSGQMNYFDGASKGIRIHVNGFTGQLDATSI